MILYGRNCLNSAVNYNSAVDRINLETTADRIELMWKQQLTIKQIRGDSWQENSCGTE